MKKYLSKINLKHFVHNISNNNKNDNIYREMLTNVLRILVKNPFKESFYRKRKRGKKKLIF